MRRQSAPTNATPSPLARFDECPHRDAHLRSAARHCHPPITRPSFMSRLERIRTIPVVYAGNRAGLLEKRSAAAPPDSPMRWPGSRIGEFRKPGGRASGSGQFDCGRVPGWKRAVRGAYWPDALARNFYNCGGHNDCAIGIFLRSDRILTTRVLGHQARG